MHILIFEFFKFSNLDKNIYEVLFKKKNEQAKFTHPSQFDRFAIPRNNLLGKELTQVHFIYMGVKKYR